MGRSGKWLLIPWLGFEAKKSQCMWLV